jgi:hypothetical protein
VLAIDYHACNSQPILSEEHHGTPEESFEKSAEICPAIAEVISN